MVKPVEGDWHERLKGAYAATVAALAQSAEVVEEVSGLSEAGGPARVIAAVMMLSEGCSAEVCAAPQNTREQPASMWAARVVVGIQCMMNLMDDAVAERFCEGINQRMEDALLCDEVG